MNELPPDLERYRNALLLWAQCQMPAWMLAECAWDADPKTRELVQSE